MDIPKINLAALFTLPGKLHEGWQIINDLKTWWTFVSGYAKVELEGAWKDWQHASTNCLIRLKKVTAAAAEEAKKTNTPLDDQATAYADSLIDHVLSIFHAEDDYQKLSNLDNITAPK